MSDKENKTIYDYLAKLEVLKYWYEKFFREFNEEMSKESGLSKKFPELKKDYFCDNFLFCEHIGNLLMDFGYIKSRYQNTYDKMKSRFPEETISEKEFPIICLERQN
jgi:hypothetical protein